MRTSFYKKRNPDRDRGKSWTFGALLDRKNNNVEDFNESESDSEPSFSSFIENVPASKVSRQGSSNSPSRLKTENSLDLGSALGTPFGIKLEKRAPPHQQTDKDEVETPSTSPIKLVKDSPKGPGNGELNLQLRNFILDAESDSTEIPEGKSGEIEEITSDQKASPGNSPVQKKEKVSEKVGDENDKTSTASTTPNKPKKKYKRKVANKKLDSPKGPPTPWVKHLSDSPTAKLTQRLVVNSHRILDVASTGRSYKKKRDLLMQHMQKVNEAFKKNTEKWTSPGRLAEKVQTVSTAKTITSYLKLLAKARAGKKLAKTVKPSIQNSNSKIKSKVSKPSGKAKIRWDTELDQVEDFERVHLSIFDLYGDDLYEDDEYTSPPPVEMKISLADMGFQNIISTDDSKSVQTDISSFPILNSGSTPGLDLDFHKQPENNNDSESDWSSPVSRLNLTPEDEGALNTDETCKIDKSPAGNHKLDVKDESDYFHSSKFQQMLDSGNEIAKAPDVYSSSESVSFEVKPQMPNSTTTNGSHNSSNHINMQEREDLGTGIQSTQNRSVQRKRKGKFKRLLSKMFCKHKL